MLGWRLFRHSFLMVLRNFVPALQIFLVPALIAMAIIFFTTYAIGLPSSVTELENAGPSEGLPSDFALSFAIVFAVVFVTTLFIVAWTVVAWHRFVLLEEYPQGWMPTLRTDRIRDYIWRIFALALASMALLLPVGLLGALLVAAPALAAPLFLAYAFFAAVVIMRWSITLPAAAIGEPLTLAKAYAETSGAAGAIVVILLCNIGLSLFLQAVSFALNQVPALFVIWNVPTQVFVSILNVSIITTLYGHYVEKREID